jgi:hypothetical protein
MGENSMKTKNESFAPPVLQLGNGLIFQPHPQTGVKEADEISSFLSHYPNLSDANTVLLKRARQREVLRLTLTTTPQTQSVVVKLFPLSNPSSILRHKKYARREYINYIHARKRGIPTPKILGSVEQRKIGFVRLSGIIIEDIGDVPDGRNVAVDDYPNSAMACIPALAQLYAAGANHIDARDENFMFKGGAAFVIDWQYASFTSPKAPWLLEHLAAYFIVKAPQEHRIHLKNTWLPHLHDTANHESTFPDFEHRVNLLLASRQSVRARLTLKPAK